MKNCIKAQFQCAFLVSKILLSFLIHQGGVQLFIKIVCILQVRYFKDSGNDVLSPDFSAKVKFRHKTVKKFSVVITN